MAGPVSAAVGGGILSAPADDESLTACPAQAKRFLLHYNPGFVATLDPIASKAKPVPLQLSNARKAYFLLEAFQMNAPNADGTSYSAPTEGYSMRMEVLRDGKPIKYRDIILVEPKEFLANAIFQDVPAEPGDILYLNVYHDLQILFEDTPVGKIKHCIYGLPPNYAADWKDLNKADLFLYHNLPKSHFLGAVQVSGFSEKDEIYQKPEEPYIPFFRTRYGSTSDKVLDGNPKSAATILKATDALPLKLLLEVDFHFDVTDMSKHEWIPICARGPQLRLIVIPRDAKSVSEYRIYDESLDGFVHLANGMGISFEPEARPSVEQLSGAYNLIFKNLTLQDGDRIELYYYAQIDEKSSPPEWTYYKAIPLLDEASLRSFKENPYTYYVGTFQISDR